MHYPNIDPVIVQIGPLAIHWYGLMYLVGIAGGWWLLQRRAKLGRHPGWNQDQMTDLVVWVAFGVVLGGRIGSILFYNFGSFLRDPLMILRIWEGGMSFHGGLIGVMVAIAWFARKHGKRFWELVDVIAPVVPIGLGAGRIGNFINGELWGKVSDLPWAMQLPCDQARFIQYCGAQFEGWSAARHPSQLYECLLEGVVMFVVLYWYSRKPRPVGRIAGLFALMYGTFRFLVEFVRLPDAHIGYLAWGWLTMGQLLSLPLILLGIWLIWRSRSQPVLAGEKTA